MSAPRRGRFGSAILGVVVTAVFVRYQMLANLQSPGMRDSPIMLAFVVLCPASLLSVAVDTEIGTNNFYFLWTVIALLNGGFYAMVRGFVNKRLRRPE